MNSVQSEIVRRWVLRCAIVSPLVGMLCLVSYTTSAFSKNGWIYDYQTLIGGMIAIFAAFMGGSYINKQIEFSKKIEEERIRRKFTAARSVLPFSLDKLIFYSNSCIFYLKEIYNQRDGSRVGLGGVSHAPPELPAEFISDMRELIEYSDGAVLAVFLMIMRDMQIQRARIIGFHRYVSTQGVSVGIGSINNYIIDSIKLYIMANNLYRYGRFDVGQVREGVSFSEVDDVLGACGFNCEQDPEIYKLAKLLFADGAASGES